MAKSNPFTLADLEAKGFVVDDTGAYVKKKFVTTVADGSVDKSNIKIKKSSRPKALITKEKPQGYTAIELVLKNCNLSYITEYKFNEERKFRFDFFIPSLNVGIEYEGLVSAKSRHTTLKGYTRDCSKYNLCQIQGIKVLRYTALNYGDFVEDLKKLL